VTEPDHQRPDTIAGRVSAGREIRSRAQGARTEDLFKVVASLDRELPEWVDSFVFGTVWARPGLSFEERMLVAIGALAAGGHTTQLRTYLHGALQAGIAEEKIQEVLMMMVVYAGFPPAVTAMDLWQSVRRSYARGQSSEPPADEA
jgi:4-carboxymuconolactone decarboxylase